ncbi:MAG: helix-turn-helix transcriptional regulator [Acidimicrobiales bacterium]
MRASRLVGLVLTLQQRGRSTAAQLAEEFEVSIRTIYRDVTALQGAGVPVWTEPGPGGGIHLLAGWSGRLDGLTVDETDALALAATPAVAADLGLDTLMSAAQSKLVDALPPELRSRATRVRERFLLDAPGWFHRDEPVEALATVADAVWTGRRLDLRYQRADRTIGRRVDPLGLVLKGGTWYLVAAHRGTPRSYRLARVADAAALDQAVSRPAGFDLASWWRESGEEFERSLLRSTATVRVDPVARRQLARAVGTASAGAATELAGPDDAGWITLEVPVESEEVALGQLLTLGAGVEVLAPVSLRRSLAEIGATIAARNGTGPG